jgi:hypothetical protein
MQRPALHPSQATGSSGRRTFRSCRKGSLGTVLAISLPAILGLIGIAVDYASFSSQRTQLQKAADAAAIAAAKELSITAPNVARITAIADAVVRSQIPIGKGDSNVIVEATVTDENRSIRISLTQRKAAIMSQIVTPALTDLSVSATASLSGSQKVCIVALEGRSSAAIGLDNSARVTARDCAIFSNSNSPHGVTALGISLITSPTICSSGGYMGTSKNYATPQRLVDCPAKDDPLADRPPPQIGSCTNQQKLVITQTRSLTPGVYCGGVEITMGATVTLGSGVFVFKDGPLTVADGATLSGMNVGLHFSGVGARFDFLSGAKIRISAPKDGPMAGILIHGDPSAESTRLHKVSSDDARVLLGVIYIPRGILVIDSNNSVSEDSPWTAIVAQRLDLKRSANLVLRTDYGLTDVPVPAGIGPAKNVRLTR